MACSFPWFFPFRFLSRAHLKTTVYAIEVSDVQDWQQRTQNDFQIIRTTPAVFQ
jgi:hypothetical protein